MEKSGLKNSSSSIYIPKKSLNDRIKCCKRLNFDNQILSVAASVEPKLKVNDMEKQALSAVVEQVETSDSFELEDVLNTV